jgi:magnesium transporter
MAQEAEPRGAEALVEDLVERIGAAPAEGGWRELEAHHPADLAKAAANLEPRERAAFLEHAPAEMGARVLEEFDDLTCRHVVRDLASTSLARLLAKMSPEAAVHVLEHVPGDGGPTLVDALPEPLGADVRRRLTWPEDSAGRIMTAEVPTVRAAGSVKEAREELRRRFGGRETIDAVFALDEEGRLVGQLRPLHLLLAEGADAVLPLVRRDAPGIPPEMDQEEAADVAVRYDLLALAVRDAEGRLLGALSFDDVFDVIEEEDEEDLSIAAGTGRDAPTERTALRAIRARFPWLLVGLAGGIVSAGVLSSFEGSLERVVSLAFFVPVVLGLAGAVAIQSSSLAVRGLARGSSGVQRLPAVAWRELRVSLGMGLALGALLGGAAFLLAGRDPMVALSLFLVLLIVLVAAALGGTLIPIVLDKLGIDPAVAMGPFVTTSSDVVALSIYLGVATALVG